MREGGGRQADAAAECVGGRSDIRTRTRSEGHGNQGGHDEGRRADEAVVAGRCADQQYDDERAGRRDKDQQMTTRDTAVRMNCRSRWS